MDSEGIEHREGIIKLRVLNMLRADIIKQENDSRCDARRFLRREIDQYLCIYGKNQRFAETAYLFSDNSILVEFRRFVHPFQFPQPKHLTREHAVVYASQAACIFFGIMAETRPEWPFSQSELILGLLEERALIHKICIKFSKMMELNEPTSVKMSLKNYRENDKKVWFFSTLDFKIGHTCYGEMGCVLLRK